MNFENGFSSLQGRAVPQALVCRNRPGRVSAGSRDSGRLVAARIITPLLPSKPSISVRSWFKVCSRSSLPPIWPSRFLPMASISSINTIQGAFSFACLNRSRTLEAPIPTNISTNSEPDMEKNGTPASPATAFASMVLPVPGGPTSRTPFGMEAPTSVYFFGIMQIIYDFLQDFPLLRPRRPHRAKRIPSVDCT